MNRNVKGEVKIQPSILARAVKNDPEALKIMFRQFIPEDEEIHLVQYLGLKGIWGIGEYSFACLTNRRVADISLGRFSEVIYQDGYLEFINSSVLYQPSKLALYLFIVTWLVLGFVIALIISYLVLISLDTAFSFITVVLLLTIVIVVVPYLVKFYYGTVKCGIVFWIREGVPIYIFSNRKFIKRANTLCRALTISREKRLKIIQER
ncbi:MAG: hypothetical protein AAGA46_06730 [Cyanobacteria bacterium P01_F01_bin.13]